MDFSFPDESRCIDPAILSLPGSPSQLPSQDIPFDGFDSLLDFNDLPSSLPEQALDIGRRRSQSQPPAWGYSHSPALRPITHQKPMQQPKVQSQRFHPYPRPQQQPRFVRAATSAAHHFPTSNGCTPRANIDWCIDKPQDNYIFKLHHDMTSLSLGLETYISQIASSCEAMRRFMQQGFSNGDSMDPRRREVEKYVRLRKLEPLTH